MSQTAYTTNMTVARRGQLADIAGAQARLSRIAEGGALTMGNVIQQGTAFNQVKAIAALPAADTDSIATALASAATATTFELTDLDGVIGDGAIVPAQQITLALNNHADWLASTVDVVGEGPGGGQHVETLHIPANGNVTLVTASAFRRVTRIELDAQGGTNGTIDVGTDPTVVSLDAISYPGIVLYDTVKESYSAAAEVAQYTQCTVLVRGRVWVQVEAAVAIGDQLWVRMVESGTDLRGQCRGSAATGFWPYPNAHFITDQSSADGLAIVELGGR